MSQFFKLFLLVTRKPLLIMPTIHATKETMVLCDSLFGMSHHKSNKANASRHAIWNYLLCQKSFKIIKNGQKSANWARKVANLYEKVTNNDVLDEFMDLHNNQIGRKVFLEQKGAHLKRGRCDARHDHDGVVRRQPLGLSQEPAITN